MSEYTPSTKEVRARYINGVSGYVAEMKANGAWVSDWKPRVEVSAEEFDRWLMSERARIWDEGARAGALSDKRVVDRYAPLVNPYRKGGDE